MKRNNNFNYVPNHQGMNMEMSQFQNKKRFVQEQRAMFQQEQRFNQFMDQSRQNFSTANWKRGNSWGGNANWNDYTQFDSFPQNNYQYGNWPQNDGFRGPQNYGFIEGSHSRGFSRGRGRGTNSMARGTNSMARGTNSMARGRGGKMTANPFPNKAVSQTAQNSKKKARKAETSNPANPSAGNVELAIGSLVNALKETYQGPPHNIDFSKAPRLKLLKQKLRQQLNAIASQKKTMMPVNEMLARYRKIHPKSKDGELVEILKEVDVLSVDKDEAWEYFNTNVSIAVERKLDEAFLFLQHKYEDIMNTPLEEITGPLPTSTAEETKTSNEQPKDQMMDNTINDKDSEVYGYDLSKPIDKSELQEKYEKILNTLLAQNLSKILPKYKTEIIKMVFSEKDLRDKTIEEKFNFVKIVGVPKLPAKQLVSSFLHECRPLYMRKHKVHHNVLFVAVKDVEKYETLLAKNGTVIENCKLRMRPYKYGYSVVDEDFVEKEPEVSASATEGDGTNANKDAAATEQTTEAVVEAKENGDASGNQTNV